MRRTILRTTSCLHSLEGHWLGYLVYHLVGLAHKAPYELGRYAAYDPSAESPLGRCASQCQPYSSQRASKRTYCAHILNPYTTTIKY